MRSASSIEQDGVRASNTRFEKRLSAGPDARETTRERVSASTCPAFRASLQAGESGPRRSDHLDRLRRQELQAGSMASEVDLLAHYPRPHRNVGERNDQK